MTIDRPFRVGALTLATAIVLAACGGGASTAPSSAPSTAPGATAEGSNGPTSPEPPTGDVVLQGAGATFPNPLYQVWFEAFNYQYNNIQIDYQSIGSGGGIKAITEQTVDFGASDAPMKDAEIAALPAGSAMLHIPTALGAVVVIFNLGDLKDLNLDSDNVANIFLGKDTAKQFFEQSLRLREQFVAADPKNTSKQIALMLAQARCGRHVDASLIANQIRESSSKDRGNLFYVGCCYALCVADVAQGKAADQLTAAELALQEQYANSAVETIRQAIELGYNDVVALEMDPDLEPILQLPAYRELIAKLKEQPVANR